MDPRLLTVTGGPDRTRRSLGVADDAPLLGTVGRLVPVKGLDYFLCGPPGLIQDTLEALAALGVPEHRVHTEQFDMA